MIPHIIWKGSPNYGIPRGTQGRNGYKAIAIVDHIMAGTLIGTDAWFNNRNSRVSAHFGVGKNGEIHQYVDIKNTAWHAGNVRNPDWSLLIPNVNPNLYTIGIEHEGQTGDIITEVQYQSTLTLHRWLIEQLGIISGSETIIAHHRIDSVNKARCPGTGFPWSRLLANLTQKESEQVEEVNVVEKGIYYNAFRCNGKTYVELRSYATQDDKTVIWDEPSKTATITGGKLEEIRVIIDR
jgi:N-acetyl-anhydromuramyl-L-alanine amidase AmpD